MPKQPKDLKEKNLKEERLAAIKAAFVLTTLMITMISDDTQRMDALDRMTKTLYEKLFPTFEKRKYTKKKKEDKITVEPIKEKAKS